MVHVDEQQSLPSLLPSSQRSFPSRPPFPQLLQMLLSFPGSHVHPVSTEQLASQPSPPALFLSSHVSAPTFLPSPQTIVQVLGVPVHAYPHSSVHVALHPSFPLPFPSSQRSSSSLMPFPQSLQTLMKGRSKFGLAPEG
jgi:hypothetical protein